jgi:hypothetical protein
VQSSIVEGNSKKRHTHARIPGVSSFQRAKVLQNR